MTTKKGYLVARAIVKANMNQNADPAKQMEFKKTFIQQVQSLLLPDVHIDRNDI